MTTPTRPACARAARCGCGSGGRQWDRSCSCHALLPARLGNARQFAARNRFTDLHAGQTEAEINTARTSGDRASVATAAGARVARQLLQLRLRVGTHFRIGLRAANELFQLSALRRVLLHDLGATLLALDHVSLGHTLWFLTCGTGN